MDCSVNGQSVQFMFDTGAEGPMLFRKTAGRLNLTIDEPPDDVVVEPGKMKAGFTEPCRFQLIEGGTESEITFAVVDIPEFLNTDIEGILGWGGLKHNLVEINPSLKKAMIRTSLDFDKDQWMCLDIRTDLNILVVKTASQNSTDDLLLIDTGSSNGLTVGKQLWPLLTDDETNQKRTLLSVYYPSAGLIVEDEMWVQKMDFGELSFSQIPVTRGLEAHIWLTNENVDGILGMWGISCYQWIIDGPAGKIYYKQNDLIRIPQTYDYNRLGAVFVPEDVQTTNELIAHVIKDGPAWRAGIRDGDELLKIGSLDATKWRTDPDVMPLSQYWERPAGTIIDLVLLRDGEQKKIAVRLEEIFK